MESLLQIHATGLQGKKTKVYVSALVSAVPIKGETVRLFSTCSQYHENKGWWVFKPGLYSHIKKIV